jgi:hypothetical protein
MTAYVAVFPRLWHCMMVSKKPSVKMLMRQGVILSSAIICQPCCWKAEASFGTRVSVCYQLSCWGYTDAVAMVDKMCFVPLVNSESACEASTRFEGWARDCRGSRARKIRSVLPMIHVKLSIGLTTALW